MQLRGEFYNTMNHPNFKNPNTTLGNMLYGKITSDNGAQRDGSGAADLLLGTCMRFLCLTLSVAAAAAQTRHVVAIAHRGEHLHHPENTMPAFQEAIRLGADYIEVDVRTTADGKLVLSHDGTVDRCTNGHGEVAKMTFEEIRGARCRCQDGAGVRRHQDSHLRRGAGLARGKIGVYVDVKNASARDLVDHIVGHGMADHVVIYCHLNLAKEIQELNPRLKIMPESTAWPIPSS